MTTIQWHEPRVRHHEARHVLSRAGNRVFLHIANLEYRKTVEASFALEGLAVKGGRVFQIAPGELDERMLKDIGITRSDAEFLMNKPFWRE